MHCNNNINETIIATTSLVTIKELIPNVHDHYDAMILMYDHMQTLIRIWDGITHIAESMQIIMYDHNET